MTCVDWGDEAVLAVPDFTDFVGEAVLDHLGAEADRQWAWSGMARTYAVMFSVGAHPFQTTPYVAGGTRSAT